MPFRNAIANVLRGKFKTVAALAASGAGALALALLVAAPMQNGGLLSKAYAADAAFSDEQKSAIGDIVKDYLLKHPEVLDRRADRTRGEAGEGASRKA